MKNRITLSLPITFLVNSGSVLDVFGRKITYDYMNSNVGPQKSISWNTSSFGSRFGHILISIDPTSSPSKFPVNKTEPGQTIFFDKWH